MMCRSCAQRPPHGRRCPGYSDPIRREQARIRQRIGRYDRAARAAADRQDWTTLARYVELLDRDIALCTRPAGPASPPSQDRPSGAETPETAIPQPEPEQAGPDTVASLFTPVATVDWSDDDLMQAFGELNDDPAAQEQILATLEWREQLEADRDAEIAAHEQQRQAERNRAWSSTAADESPLTNPARRPRRRLSADQVCQEEYDSHVYTSYVRAETDCRGVLLNRDGLVAGVDPVTLFSGPASRVRKYASEELRTWFSRHGRITYGDWRFQWLGRESDRNAARTARSQSLGEATA